jgi:hypothetical protein
MLHDYDFELIDEDALLSECCQQSFVEAILMNDADHKSTEYILLSMLDADESTPTRKDVLRARNRACAQKARAADKLFIQLMQEELKEILETLELYATYTANLRMHSSCDTEAMHVFEQRHMTHKVNVSLLLMNECSEKDNPDASHQTLPTEYMVDLTKERDESFLTLDHVMKYTTELESSCSFLEDLNEYVSANLMEVRQKLFDRTCAHHDKYPQLESYLIFRGTYRVNFK